MIQFNFIPQQVKGKPRVLGQGLLTVNKKHATFFEGEATFQSSILGTLKHAEIVFMNSKGIMLKGYEPAGTDKQGIQKFNYQEWWCSYV